MYAFRKLSLLFALLFVHGVCLGQANITRDSVQTALRKAATYYREKVAVHGGYVYHYTIGKKGGERGKPLLSRSGSNLQEPRQWEWRF